MPNFTLEKINHPNSKFTVCKLCKDRKIIFDHSSKKLERNYAKELIIIQTIIEEVSQNEIENILKIKELKHRDTSYETEETTYQEYEVKTKRLRTYLFKYGKQIVIVANCHFKKDEQNQKKEISKFRVLKKEFIEFETETKNNEDGI